MTRSSEDLDDAASVPGRQPTWVLVTVGALFTLSLVLWAAVAPDPGTWFFLLLYVASAVAAVAGRSAARYSVIFTALFASLIVRVQATGTASLVLDLVALVASGAGVVLLIWWPRENQAG